MIILDTNIISELMKNTPSVNVISWMAKQEDNLLFITSVTIAEISFGLHALPKGKRRELLETSFEKVVHQAFKQHILTFDEASAWLYGKIMGNRKKSGRPLSICDGQIAAIALAHEAKIATRNTDDFRNCGLEFVNPFLD